MSEDAVLEKRPGQNRRKRDTCSGQRKIFVRQCARRRQDVTTGEAGCRVKTRQDVAARLLTHKNIAPLLAQTLPGCRQAAYSRLAKRRCTNGSGRRDSNPRQPAWKAGCYKIVAHLIYIGLTAGFIRFISNVSGPGKRCRVRFLRLSAKHVTCFCL
jgi:hypothetical protein